jgi:hypothetical protein
MSLSDRLFITLNTKNVREYSAPIRLNAALVVKAYEEGDQALEEFIETIKNLVDKEESFYSEIEEVVETLASPRMKKDSDGLPIIDQQGQPQKIPLPMKSQRAFLRIMDLIEDAQTKAELEGVDFDKAGAELTIEFPPRLALYLAERVKERCGEYYSANLAIVELHDKFVDLKADAQKIIDKLESDDEVEGDLSEDEDD